MLVERAAGETNGFEGSVEDATNGLIAAFVEDAELKSPVEAASPVEVANGFEVGGTDKDAFPEAAKDPGAVDVAPPKLVAADAAKGLASELVVGPADED